MTENGRPSDVNTFYASEHYAELIPSLTFDVNTRSVTDLIMTVVLKIYWGLLLKILASTSAHSSPFIWHTERNVRWHSLKYTSTRWVWNSPLHFLLGVQHYNSSLSGLIPEVSRSLSLSLSHTHTRRLLWMSDQPVAEAGTCTTDNKHTRRPPVPSAAFEHAVPEIKQLQTYTLHRTVYGNGFFLFSYVFLLWTCFSIFFYTLLTA
jgi:hypothetical protein